MESENKKVPQCIGIIVDGNRRWARERGLPTLEGHRAGFDRLGEFLDWASEAGIKHVVAYVFSTENWNRSLEEVSYLMDLFRTQFGGKMVSDLREKGYRIRVAGNKACLAPDLQELVRKAELETEDCKKMTVTLALSYGGRDEILAAVNALLADSAREKGSVTKDEFEKHLWTSDLPDLDMIIRTGGERRLSNFMTWRSVYSELFFPKMYFPDFTKEDFHKLLDEYAARERRLGK
jgi:undecaprenyl diphosphate synthase